MAWYYNSGMGLDAGSMSSPSSWIGTMHLGRPYLTCMAPERVALFFLFSLIRCVVLCCAPRCCAVLRCASLCFLLYLPSTMMTMQRATLTYCLRRESVAGFDALDACLAASLTPNIGIMLHHGLESVPDQLHRSSRGGRFWASPPRRADGE